jgi:hypothetical protein
MTSSAYMLIALIIAAGSCQEPRPFSNYAKPRQTLRPRAAVWRIACPWPLLMPARAVPSASVGKRNPPTAPTGPRRKSSSSIVLN